MRFGVVLLTCFLGFSLLPALAQYCEENPFPEFPECRQGASDQFMIAEVNLRAEGGATADQRSSIKQSFHRGCFDNATVGALPQRLAEEYQRFGYLHPNVSIPVIEVLGSTRFPKPVRLTFDVVEASDPLLSRLSGKVCTPFPLMR
jgi:hypothetical protein